MLPILTQSLVEVLCRSPVCDGCYARCQEMSQETLLVLVLQAVAKLRFDDTVIRSDVDAAIALMRASQASIEPELQKRTREDPVSRLYLVSCAPCTFVQMYRMDSIRG